jgi:hypothetical protein
MNTKGKLRLLWCVIEFSQIILPSRKHLMLILKKALHHYNARAGDFKSHLKKVGQFLP